MSRGRNNRGWGISLVHDAPGAFIGLPCYRDSIYFLDWVVGLALKGATDGQIFVPSYDYPIYQSALVHSSS